MYTSPPQTLHPSVTPTHQEERVGQWHRVKNKIYNWDRNSAIDIWSKERSSVTLTKTGKLYRISTGNNGGEEDRSRAVISSKQSKNCAGWVLKGRWKSFNKSFGSQKWLSFAKSSKGQRIRMHKFLPVLGRLSLILLSFLLRICFSSLNFRLFEWSWRRPYYGESACADILSLCKSCELPISLREVPLLRSWTSITLYCNTSSLSQAKLKTSEVWAILLLYTSTS